MSAYKDNSRKSDAWRFPHTLQTISIFSFIKKIEKDFFAEVTVQNFGYIEDSFSISIQLDCNLSLIEILNHANLGTWGDFKNNRDINPLCKAIETLQNENNCNIAISEFSLFLKDTSIIINETNNLNIAKELNNILKEIASQYIYITNGFTKKPYEIYIPVLEENDFDMEMFIPEECGAKSYNEYWGIYFESEEEAVIYDVKENSYLPEELHLCLVEY